MKNESTDETKVDESIRIDPNFKNNYTPTYVGIASIIVSIALLIFVASLGKSYFAEIVLFSQLILALIFKVFAIIWCGKIAKKIDRNVDSWYLLAFFLPAIALISIGFQKKYIYSKRYPYFDDKTKSIENNNIAIRKAKSKDYENAIVFANKAIELNPLSHVAYDTLAYTQYFLKQYEDALNNVNKSIELDPNYSIKYFHKGYILKELNRLEDAVDNWQIAANMGEERAKKALQSEFGSQLISNDTSKITEQ